MSPGQFLDAVYPHIIFSGGTVTSWYRNKKYNTVAGGVMNSYHLCGLAVDVADFNSDEARALFVERMNKLKFGVLDYGTYVHVQALRKVTP